MARPVTKAGLLKQMEVYFPDRWEVTHLASKTEGRTVSGAIKIRCSQDEKVFLSDFSAKLDRKGKIQELTLDGVSVGKYVGRLHETPEGAR